ncbi:MAG: transglutaminase-like domain-containing protein [Thermodesulfobacteriota bacterium]
MITCRTLFIVFLTLATFSITQTTGFAGTSTIPNVVTADIQAGIEHYIEEQTRLGGGYFKLPFKEKELKLKLVRVHTEYLANLGPRYHFACVDVADIGGDLYDVDFFLKGDPGAMTVTETTVHKINGQLFYTWEQKEDKTWHRVPVEGASQNLLGVLRGHDEFDFLYTVTLPEITESARMWLPLPTSDAFQTVEVSSMEVPGKRQILKDKKYGNQVLLVDLDREDSRKNVELLFHVRRIEKDAYAEPLSDPDEYLKPNRLVPLNDDFKSIAEKVVKGKNGDLVRARALYDYVIDNMRYIRNGEGWGNGDAVYACSVKTGNCTDFHSYFIALSRSIGIPARFAMGVAIPSSRNEGGIHGYHCNAEFYAEGKWWPVDISEADKYSNLASYYFGRHPANRIELSRGRDIAVEPGPVTGQINFLAHPVLEIGGNPVKIKAQFSFNRKIACKGY